MNFQEWLEAKYIEWEKTQPGRQSYYNFARYLDVSHAALTQWINGVASPSEDEVARMASLLGDEIYGLVGGESAENPFTRLGIPFSHLPKAVRVRLSEAITEIDQQFIQRKLDPESLEAKRLAVKIFDKWGFHISD